MDIRGSSFGVDSRELQFNARFTFSVSYTGYLTSD